MSAGEEKKRLHPESGTGPRIAKKPFVSQQPQDGHTGVLVTADRGREDRSAKELIDLFEEVAEKYYPVGTSNLPVDDNNDESVSLQTELAKEIQDLKRKKTKRRFHVVKTGCKNLVLIRFVDQIDPNQFVPQVFEHLTTEVKRPRTRYSNRIIPIEKTCFVSEASIAATIAPIIERVFHTENPDNKPFTFKVELKVRNNDRLNKDDLKRVVAGLVGKGHFVDLKSPAIIIQIEVFGKAAGVSIINAAIYDAYKGFNVRTVSATFGEPLPPHPNDPPKPPKNRPTTSSSSEASSSLAPIQTNTHASNEVDDLTHEDSHPSLNEDLSDSDSDNGGISIF